MLQHQLFRPPTPGQPLVIAAFSFRYDAHLVPDLLENIRPAVHGFVAWDDRAADTALSDEPGRRARLVAAAKALGADWLLTPDPDERFEHGFAAAVPALLAEGDRCLWLFALREMFSATHYRTDGLWGAKAVLRLLPIPAASADPAKTLHGNWVADESGFQRRDARLNLYHLRMALPDRRQLRRDLYAAADPERRFQPLGYDYLADDRGMILEPLPPGRAFIPAFVEDHGLWAPPPGASGPIQPDPYPVRLTRAARSARRRGKLAAHHVMRDLCQHSPDDDDLRQIAARFAFEGGDPETALAMARTNSLGDLFLCASARVALGQLALAQTDLALLHAAVPGSPLLAALQAEVDRPTTDFTAPTALWRSHAPDATCLEGAQICRSDLAVTVIGFQNQPGLLAAVRSLLTQDQVPEIVVVNSGGGDVTASLAPVIDRIRLIFTDQPLYVGAARNIGVAASRAPFLAFLAGDCLACAGWVSGRLVQHHAGAKAVATAVVGDDSTFAALAANRLNFASRSPRADLRQMSFYGQSYCRGLLGQVGHFPAGLRVGEDTVLNRAVATLTAPVWTASVQTLHHEVTSLAALLCDQVARGQRRAAHPPFRAHAHAIDPASASAPVFARRLAVAQDLLARDPDLTAAERRALGATHWLATQADRHGTLLGMARIAQADELAARAALTADLSLARQACALDPQDADKAFGAGGLFLSAGDSPGAEAAFRMALSINPSHHPAGEALVALVTRTDGAVTGWHQAERLALAAPMVRQHWRTAAAAALLAGYADWAVALGQVMLARGVDAPAAHEALSRLHQAAGSPVAGVYRSLTAHRLGPVDKARVADGAGAKA